MTELESCMLNFCLDNDCHPHSMTGSAYKAGFLKAIEVLESLSKYGDNEGKTIRHFYCEASAKDLMQWAEGTKDE